MINNRRIIVSMTSWPKRICNVGHVVYSLYKNTVKPDSIELNLSTEEFPSQENDLPIDLQLLASNNIVKINWVHKNTNVFKKFIPVLKKYMGEEYYLFSVDDDWIYGYKYIELMLSRLGKGNCYSLQYSGSAQVIGNSTVYNSKMFSTDFWTSVTDDMVRLGISDYYITQYLLRKGYKQVSNVHEPLSNYAMAFNPVAPNSRNKNETDGNGHYDANRVRMAYEITDRIIRKFK